MGLFSFCILFFCSTPRLSAVRLSGLILGQVYHFVCVSAICAPNNPVFSNPHIFRCAFTQVR